MTARVAKTAGPVIVEGVRGWPMPDLAGDPCGPDADWYGWLPWAIIPAGRSWYVGLYSCDRGHAWSCGYGLVAHPEDPALRVLKLSPCRIVPSDGYLGDALPVRVELVDWSPVRGPAS